MRVADGLRWPRWSPMAFKDTPAAAKRVAQLCRSAWGPRWVAWIPKVWKWVRVRLYRALRERGRIGGAQGRKKARGAQARGGGRGKRRRGLSTGAAPGGRRGPWR